MSINLPQRGQPIDYNYISQIVEAINSLSAIVAPKASDSKFNDGINKEVLRSSQMMFVAGYHDVTKIAKDEKVGSEETFTYSFGTNFRYAPIVTITPKAKDNSVASKDVIVVITATTTSSVTGIIKFKTAGSASVGLNIIAVGIPYSS